MKQRVIFAIEKFTGPAAQDVMQESAKFVQEAGLGMAQKVKTDDDFRAIVADANKCEARYGMSKTDLKGG